MRIECKGISFTYPGAPSPALADCAFSLDTREVTVLVGDNGAGKSSAIRLLTGQLLGYQGDYLLDGKRAEAAKGELLGSHRFGYAPDQPVLDPYLTGAEVLDHVRRLRGLGEEDFRRRRDELREALALGDWLEGQVCREYSKGMRKKLSLAIAFLGPMQYVFLDEPFDGLDPISILRLKRLIADRKAAGQGVFLSSHLLDAAEKVADKVILMKQGRILYAGDFKELLGRWSDKGSLEAVYFELYSAR